MPAIADSIVPAAGLALNFGEQLLKGIRADQFARLAPGQDGPVQSNHPAWVFGHLAVYPGRVMEVAGVGGAEKFKNEKFSTLFKDGTPCLDDAKGTIYPPMDEIVQAWRSGYTALINELPKVSDAVLTGPNPAEGRMKELLPTVASFTSFMIAAHPMIHFGQASAWRRFMGMPAAM